MFCLCNKLHTNLVCVNLEKILKNNLVCVDLKIPDLYFMLIAPLRVIEKNFFGGQIAEKDLSSFRR